MSKPKLETARINVNFETEMIEIIVDNVKVSTISIVELIRRERVLQTPANGQCKATIDIIPLLEPVARVLLQVSADFTEAEMLGLSMIGAFPELVARRIAEPVREAIIALIEPQLGNVVRS